MCVTLAALFFAVSELALVAVRASAKLRECSAKHRLVPQRVFGKRAAAAVVASRHGCEKYEKNQDEKRP